MQSEANFYNIGHGVCTAQQKHRGMPSQSCAFFALDQNTEKTATYLWNTRRNLAEL